MAVQRAAESRAARLRQALEQLPQVEASKPAKEKANARVSATDPDARVMSRQARAFQENEAYILPGVEGRKTGHQTGK